MKKYMMIATLAGLGAMAAMTACSNNDAGSSSAVEKTENALKEAALGEDGNAESEIIDRAKEASEMTEAKDSLAQAGKDIVAAGKETVAAGEATTAAAEEKIGEEAEKGHNIIDRAKEGVEKGYDKTKDGVKKGAEVVKNAAVTGFDKTKEGVKKGAEALKQEYEKVTK